MNQVSRNKAGIALAAVALLLIAGSAALLLPGRLGWTALEGRRSLFPEQRPERHIYESTARGPVSLARFVRELRTAWPDQGIATVHDAACEVATGLLHHGDIEVGSMEENRFVRWQLPPWDAAGKISRELRSMDGFLDDESRYVFRRK